MRYEKLQKVYKLKDAATQCDTFLFLYKDCLLYVYGMNCPVQVTDASTSDIRDGEIVCPKPFQGDDGEQQVSYDLQILQGGRGSDITIEFGVAADRIKYRFEKPTNNTCVETKIKSESEREDSSVVKEVEAKAAKEEPNPKELPKFRSISTTTKSYDDTESALEPIAIAHSNQIPQLLNLLRLLLEL